MCQIQVDTHWHDDRWIESRLGLMDMAPSGPTIYSPQMCVMQLWFIHGFRDIAERLYEHCLQAIMLLMIAKASLKR